MLLFIDTTNKNQAQLVLVADGVLAKQNFSSLPKAEDFAAVVKKFLTKQNFKLTDLTKIGVRVGEGYYSHIRTGVVLANALAYALNLKIVSVTGEIDFQKVLSLKGKSMIEPVYSGNPNITKPKARKWLV